MKFCTQQQMDKRHVIKKRKISKIQKVKKVKEVDLYSASIVVHHTQGVLTYGSHNVTCKLHRTCLHLVSIRQMVHPQTEVADI